MTFAGSRTLGLVLFKVNECLVFKKQPKLVGHTECKRTQEPIPSSMVKLEPLKEDKVGVRWCG